MTVAGTVLVSVGAAFMLLAAVGILRLPDLYSRMHAGTKSASLGLACILIGAALLIGTGSALVKAVIAVLFQFGTAPVAAHVIGRAAYRAGVPLHSNNLYDDLAGDEET